MVPETQPIHEVSILVVDDHEANRLALRAILEPESTRVVEAASGAEALRALLHQEFALILLDVVMPEIDGFEVASLIRGRARTQTTPIIFLTGQAADIASMYKGYSAGAVDYLIKPLDRDVVRAKVRVFVELHLQREEIRRQADLLREADRRRAELELVELRLHNERRYRRLVRRFPRLSGRPAPTGRSIISARGGSSTRASPPRRAPRAGRPRFTPTTPRGARSHGARR